MQLLEILKGGGTHTQTDESIPAYHKAAIFYADSRVPSTLFICIFFMVTFFFVNNTRQTVSVSDSYYVIVYHPFVSFIFNLSQVTGERYCRAKQEAHHASHTYLCLLASTRNHLVLHNLYHGKGERSPEEVAGLVGLRLPTQPGGKGWEKWGHWTNSL